MRLQTPRSPWKTRFFLDTEFTSFEDCHLISVGIVSEDGREFYGERTDFELASSSDFVRKVVLPQLGQFPERSMGFEQLRGELNAWLLAVPIKPKPVLCYDYQGDYDLFCLLLGGGLPPGWRHENVAMRIDAARLSAYIAEHGGEHHALHDARANAYAYR